MPKTSIVLTVYNKPQWLNQCMDSVLAQTDADWELLVMEDNSPDERVREIIHTYDDPRILTYFSGVQESERYATARYCTLINKAVREMSSGKYIPTASSLPLRVMAFGITQAMVAQLQTPASPFPLA